MCVQFDLISSTALKYSIFLFSVSLLFLLMKHSQQVCYYELYFTQVSLAEQARLEKDMPFFCFSFTILRLNISVGEDMVMPFPIILVKFDYLRIILWRKPLICHEDFLSRIHQGNFNLICIVQNNKKPIIHCFDLSEQSGAYQKKQAIFEHL